MAMNESPLMLSDLQGTTGADDKLPPPSLPAPRVRVMRTEAGQVIEPILDEAAGAIIGHLRGESRARCTPQERGLHNE